MGVRRYVTWMRRKTIVAVARAALGAYLEPSEILVVAAYGNSRPYFGSAAFFLGLTDRRLILVKADRWGTYQAEGLQGAYQLDTVKLSQFRGGRLASKLEVTCGGDTLIIYLSRLWFRTDARRLRDGLRGKPLPPVN